MQRLQLEITCIKIEENNHVTVNKTPVEGVNNRENYALNIYFQEFINVT